jgi:hypothetical protein
MSITAFLEQAKERTDSHGLRAISSICTDTGLSVVAKAPYISEIGTNVFSKEWDILILLDACRIDLYRESINSDSESIWSIGSSSEEWLDNTFGDVDTSDTVYVTGKVFSKDYLRIDDFYELIEVWRDGWDDDEGTIPPRAITDEAIRAWRDTDAERMIVHYMQPHLPAIGSDIDVGGGVTSDEVGDGMGGVWDRMRYGDIGDESTWQAYRENLEFVWEDVELLMENVDGTVTISADHGNCFGEWGTYGHPTGLPWPQLRRVPWDTYQCSDQETYVPDIRATEEKPDASVEDRLESLGYV